MGEKEYVIEDFDPFMRATGERAGQVDRLHQKLQEAEVEWIAFGLMPASFDLRDMYKEVTTDVLDGMKETSEFMNDLAETVKHARDLYQESQDVTSEGLKTYMQGLEG